MERALLESLKYLSAQDILQIALVSKLWQTICSSDELWLHLLGPSSNLLRLQLSPAPSLREAYRLSHVLFAVITRERTLRRYYPATKKWKITNLQQDLLELADVAMVSLGTDELFCCGGKNSTKDTFKLSFATGKASFLQQMSPHKMWSGLCLYETYVFSLCGRQQTGLTSLCARFNLLTSQWETLPSALVPRQCFNPCEHQGLIYLPGGCSATVETFNPVSMQFSMLIMDCGLAGPVDCVIWQGKMHILNIHGRFRWDFEHQKGEFEEKHEEIYRGGTCFPPICRDGKAIFVWRFTSAMVYEMDLETMENAPICLQKHNRKRKRRSS